jgi:VWFA-related protein
MYRAAIFALVAAILVVAFPGSGFGQGRPRRVDPSRTVPAPTEQIPQQQPSPGQAPGGDDGEDSVTLEGALIEVPVVVSDRSGHYVPQLKAADFRVLEDGVDQPITFFSDERVPIHVAIVMDTSGSTRDTIYDIQDAAIEFLNQLIPGDQVLIVSFGNQVIVEQEFTSDRGRLASAIRRTQANGSTKLYEAVYLTVAERLRHVDGRKAMIILSDGEDTASQDVSFEEAVNVCSESDVVVYGIRYPESAGTTIFNVPNQWPNGNGYPQPRRQPRRRGGIQLPGGFPWPFAPTATNFVGPQFGGRNPGTLSRGGGQGNMGRDNFMETITNNTGGTLFYADAVADVRGLFSIIAEELRHVYVIGYSPTNSLANGGYRRITVQVPRRADLAIRHRLGYQAEAYK